MKAAVVVGALVLLVCGCGRAPLKGGSEIGDDVYWRLNTLGDGERLPADSDSVLMRIRVARQGTAPGSLYSTEQWYTVGGAGRSGAWFARMRQGDSATLLMRPGGVPWAELGARPELDLPDTAWVQLELSLRDIRTPQQTRERARTALMARTAADEERIIAGYFAAAGSGPWKQAMGLWYRLDSLSDGGPRVQSGDRVSIAYTASFLDDGRVFDEQTVADGGLTFRLGDPDQVIKGLEAAMHLLPANGGGGTFLIPSALAFGPEGSSSGIVPPWTPVLYRITVLPQPGSATAVR